MDKIIYIRKKPQFRSNEWNIKFKDDFLIETNVEELLVYKVYNVTDEELDYLINNILLDGYTNYYVESIDVFIAHLAFKLHHTQYCAKTRAINTCFMLKFSKNIEIVCGTILGFDKKLNVDLVSKLVINPVDSEIMDLNQSVFQLNYQPYKLKNYDDIYLYDNNKLLQLKNQLKLNLELDDLILIRDFCLETSCGINELELRVLETYWSDHCRHTTFNTILEDVKIDDEQINNVYQQYLLMKEEVSSKPITLMDLATINSKFLKLNGDDKDVEQSEEINACSIEVDVDGEPWLMMFKNETHNHPTEIEPFGGAATCIGGAIRDPLSGRSYVYQGLRISGSGNPFEHHKNTISGKLSQKTISQKSAAGFSSYGNQIGVATTLVREIYDESYKAKHLELGAVVGANKLENVCRLQPETGDIILIIGGRTGKDGIGGATGSSDSLRSSSVLEQASQVQKGDAIEERKLQRLFRNPSFSKKIMRCNDFGAGGVSVAIGELATSIDVYLDKVKLKYKNLNVIEISISESQERMAIVIDPNDLDYITNLCLNEGVEATHVANVTDSGFLRFYYNDELVLNLSRKFIDTNGANRYQDVYIPKQTKFEFFEEKSLFSRLSNPNFASQKSLNELFDSSVGARTVLNPYGGKYINSPENVSVVKFPKPGCNTYSVVSYDFDPNFAKNNTFLASYYAVLGSYVKIIISGVNPDHVHLSLQEYFPKLENNVEKWGQPLAALLGAFKAQFDFNVAAIGGKDSMSGSFKNIDVIPTLVSFAFSASKSVITSTFQTSNSNIYIIEPSYHDGLIKPEYKEELNLLYSYIQSGKVLSTKYVDSFGVLPNLVTSCLGNRIGCNITYNNLFDFAVGSIIVESKYSLSFEQIGHTNYTALIKANNKDYLIDECIKYYNSLENKIYNDKIVVNSNQNIDYQFETSNNFEKQISNEVRVVIPIFPGTNSEEDIANSFIKEGAIVEEVIINTLNESLLIESLNNFESAIKRSQIIAIAGGFTLGDEPDGSGKFIAEVLNTSNIKLAIEEHLKQKRLIIGICNGFQALVKSGLFANNNLVSSTLYKNNVGHHISRLVYTKFVSNNSPWLKNIELGSTVMTVISHGEGRFVVDTPELEKLLENGQVFSLYSDCDGIVNESINPNGSTFNIEGITSRDGLILGKMGHNERIDNSLFINVDGKKSNNIFKNGVDYFREV